MKKILELIKSIIPTSWIRESYWEEDEIEIFIQNPNDKDAYLSIMILPDITGIAVLYQKDDSIELDLSGFDYSYKNSDIDGIKLFMSRYKESGVPPQK